MLLNNLAFCLLILLGLSPENDFDRLTLFMFDEKVSKTTNLVENYYRNSTPDHLKRIFKTKERVMNFLDVRKEYWIENISKNV